MNAEPVPPITMTLYETDTTSLQEFIKTRNAKEEVIDKRHLVLYSFAADCIHPEFIQPDLITYLLPFYLKATQQYVLCHNKIAGEICGAFSSALFYNGTCFKNAVGKEAYQNIMNLYTELTIDAMELEKSFPRRWNFLFNTTVAFDKNNLVILFQKIFEASPEIKRSFFEYLSVLLFKESDNVLVTNAESKDDFWTDYIWLFDADIIWSDFFWSSDIVHTLTKR